MVSNGHNNRESTSGVNRMIGNERSVSGSSSLWIEKEIQEARRD